MKSIISYGSDTWTYTKDLIRRINVFQQWCYRRILKISYKDRISNIKILEEVNIKQLWAEDLAKRKLRYAGHILRGSGGRLSQLVLEGYVEGKRDRGRQRRIWGTDIVESSESRNMGEAKRKAERRDNWKHIVANLRIGDGT